MWFAIDVDVYKDDNLHANLVSKIERSALPLCVTKSKSGGVHAWCFFKSPVPAVEARTLAKTFASMLGLPRTVEIFPKQDNSREEDSGSWINLPYFGGTCHGVGPDGKASLNLDEFLAHANTRLTVPTASVKPVRANSEHSEAPPCVQRMLAEGVEEGGRNSALTQIAIYLKRAFPDDWQTRVQDWNKEHFAPSLTWDECSSIIESVEAKDYQYLCKQQPMASICDKPSCLRRKFGVGQGEGVADVLVFDALEKIDGEEPIYRIAMFGRTFQATPAQLFAYNDFRRKAMAALDRLLPPMKQAEWEQILSTQLARMDVTEAASDTEMRDRVIKKFKEWVSQTCSRNPDRLKVGIPFYDDSSKAIIFRGDDFMSVIDRTFKEPRNKVYVYMRDAGVISTNITITDADGGVHHMPVWKFLVKEPLWFDFREKGPI
jgi:hypothetical protein